MVESRDGSNAILGFGTSVVPTVISLIVFQVVVSLPEEVTVATGTRLVAVCVVVAVVVGCLLISAM